MVSESEAVGEGPRTRRDEQKYSKRGKRIRLNVMWEIVDVGVNRNVGDLREYRTGLGRKLEVDC